MENKDLEKVLYKNNKRNTIEFFYDEEKREIVPANRMVYGHKTEQP